MTTSRSGIVLFGHGARDPRWAEPFHRLRDEVARLSPDASVALAFLELMQPDLDGAADALLREGCDALVVIPIFLGVGAHLRRDLPERVDALRARLPRVPVRLADAAGEDAGVIAALAAFCLRVA